MFYNLSLTIFLFIIILLIVILIYKIIKRIHHLYVEQILEDNELISLKYKAHELYVKQMLEDLNRIKGYDRNDKILNDDLNKPL